eukprot:gene12874-biopygen8915
MCRGVTLLAPGIQVCTKLTQHTQAVCMALDNCPECRCVTSLVLGIQ